MSFRPVTVFAPAKINLTLHVTGRRDDGYHMLDSLVVFADTGDRIAMAPADSFSLSINGPFAGAFTASDRESGPTSTNLVARAVHATAAAARRTPALRVTLTKNMPLAAGIGGGSADAAATIWGLMSAWNIPLGTPFLPDLMVRLGADVPACLRCAPVHVRGIGDVMDAVPDLPEMPVVLVNPGRHCPTPDVFRHFAGPVRDAAPYPEADPRIEALVDYIRRGNNDLTPAARAIVPEIGLALDQLAAQKNCAISRMSGSGATCFGLFYTREDADNAAEAITLANPRWWVRVATINSPARY